MNQPIKISIVEDHPLMRKGIKSMLEDYPELVFFSEAGNGQDFIYSLKKESLPDVVILDLEMPVMDGIQTAEYLKNFYPEIKVLVLSMHDDESFVMHMASIGVRGYLSKDGNGDEIIMAIQSVVNNGLTKINTIEANSAKALSDLNAAIQDSNYKMINDSYTTLTNALKDKTATLNDINTQITN
ncbi:MAG: response regulator, partial [Bacteroidia bacterium]